MEELYRSIAAFGNSSLALEHQSGLTLKSMRHALTDLRAVTTQENQHLIETLQQELDYLVQWRKYVKGFGAMVQARGDLPGYGKTEIDFASMVKKLKQNLAGALVLDRGEKFGEEIRIRIEFHPIGELKKYMPTHLIWMQFS